MVLIHLGAFTICFKIVTHIICPGKLRSFVPQHLQKGTDLDVDSNLLQELCDPSFIQPMAQSNHRDLKMFRRAGAGFRTELRLPHPAQFHSLSLESL